MYRIIWPAQILQKQGRDIEIFTGGDSKIFIHKNRWDEVVEVENPECDVIVLQRVMQKDLVGAIPFLQKHGIHVVVEIDDDFAALHPQNIAFRATNPLYNENTNWNFLKEACRIADQVVVATPALADRYGAHGRVRVVPNCVPEWYLKMEPLMREDPVIGWTGTLSTHPDDPKVLGTTLSQFENFRFIGGDAPKVYKKAFSLRKAPEVIPWISLMEYPIEIAELDIGLVPLADTKFNAAKSWLKGLEFAAIGVPFIASNTSEYERLKNEGAGLTAAKPKHWLRHLKALQDVSARKELSRSGKEAAGRWTIEKNAWKWWEAWTDF